MTNKEYDGSLKSVAFRRLVAARVSNEFSQSMATISVTVLLVAITGQAALVGISAGVYTACLILSQIISGAVVDRVRADRALFWSAVVQALGWAIVLAGALHHDHPVFFTTLVVAGSIISGLASGLDAPAEFALARQIVAKEHFHKAAAIAQGRESFASVSSNPIAGVLATIGHAVPLITQIIFSLLAAMLVPSSTRRETDTKPQAGAGGAITSFAREVTEGFSYVFSDSGLRAIALISGFANFAMALLPMTLLVHYTKAGAESWKLGILSATMGIAMISGAWFAERFSARFTFFAAGVVACAGLTTGSIVLPTTLGSLPLTCVVLVGMFFFLPLFNSGCSAYMAFSCTDENEGRVAAATGVPGMALMPVGAIVGGFLFDSYGALPGVWVCAVVFAVSLLMVVTSSRFRTMPRFTDMAAH